MEFSHIANLILNVLKYSFLIFFFSFFFFLRKFEHNIGEFRLMYTYCCNEDWAMETLVGPIHFWFGNLHGMYSEYENDRSHQTDP